MKVNLKEVFASNLKKYLCEFGMTQHEFAKRLDVGPAIVSNWINAEKGPRFDKIEKMCKVFNCEASDFFERHEVLQEELSSQELEIITAFRALDDSCKSIILAALHLDG